MGNAKIKIANNANTPKITFDKMAMNDAEKVFLDINSLLAIDLISYFTRL